MFSAKILIQNMPKSIIFENIVKFTETWGPSSHSFDRLWRGLFPRPLPNYSHLLISFSSLSFYFNTNTFDSYSILTNCKSTVSIGTESRGQLRVECSYPPWNFLAPLDHLNLPDTGI